MKYAGCSFDDWNLNIEDNNFSPKVLRHWDWHLGIADDHSVGNVGLKKKRNNSFIEITFKGFHVLSFNFNNISLSEGKFLYFDSPFREIPAARKILLQMYLQKFLA